jgi:hypothetical protein
MAFDERHDVRVVRSAEKVTFPVTWHGAVIGIGWPFTNGDGPTPLGVASTRTLSMGPTLEITIMGVLKISLAPKSPGCSRHPAHEPASLMGSWTHSVRTAFLAR